MKITVITACYNSARTIRDALTSVARQRLADADQSGTRNDVELEHLVIDGGSTDGTVEIIREFAARQTGEDRKPNFSFKWISERDKGLYDALNKGIRLATGDAIGICNADDILADDAVIARVAAGFSPASNGEIPDVTYADIRFVRAEGLFGVEALRAAPVCRFCTGRYFRTWMFRFATFPAHPSTFVRKACFDQFGLYSLDYSICADFEMMLRLFVKHGVRTRYLPLCTHVMRMGGMSTGGLRSNVAINSQDLRALKAHGIWSCLPLIYLKYFAKIWGFVRRRG